MKYTFAPGEAPAEVNGAQQRKAIAGAIRDCLSCVVDDMIANPYSVSRRTYYTYEAEIIVELIDLAYYAMLAKSKADPDTCRFVELDGEVIGRALSAKGEQSDPHLIDFSKYTA